MRAHCAGVLNFANGKQAKIGLNLQRRKVIASASKEVFISIV